MADLRRKSSSDEFSRKLVAQSRGQGCASAGSWLTALTVGGDGKGQVLWLRQCARGAERVQKAMQAARKKLLPHGRVTGTHCTAPERSHAPPASCNRLRKDRSIDCGAMRAVSLSVPRAQVLAKIYGSRNPVNVVRATIKALQASRSPELIAAKRGKSVSDIRD